MVLKSRFASPFVFLIFVGGNNKKTAHFQGIKIKRPSRFVNDNDNDSHLQLNCRNINSSYRGSILLRAELVGRFLYFYKYI